MPLNEIRPGLRVINKSQDVSKVTIHVAAGDELEVSEDVAAQLAAQNQDFAAVGSEAAGRAVPYPPVEDEPIGTFGGVPVYVEDDPNDPSAGQAGALPKPKPRKRNARK